MESKEESDPVAQDEVRREMTSPPGFLCPICQEVRIKLSLAAFLSQSDVRCPNCGSRFEMDKSQCLQMVELLQDLHNADQNLQALTRGFK